MIEYRTVRGAASDSSPLYRLRKLKRRKDSSLLLILSLVRPKIKHEKLPKLLNLSHQLRQARWMMMEYRLSSEREEVSILLFWHR